MFTGVGTLDTLLCMDTYIAMRSLITMMIIHTWTAPGWGNGWRHVILLDFYTSWVKKKQATILFLMTSSC